MSPDELRDFLVERSINFKQEEIQNGYLSDVKKAKSLPPTTLAECLPRKATELSKAVKDWKKPAKAARRNRRKQ